ncbi:MAG: NAD(P)H-hydrate dehydratase [Candidatus Brocadiia bacterium]
MNGRPPVEVGVLPDLPERPRDAHKGQFGHVLVVGGSPGLTGAACMAARAAQRAGAGLVTLALPGSLNLVAEIKLTSAMSIPLPEPDGPVLGETAVEAVLESLDRFTVLALGPGLGRAEPTGRAVRTLVAEVRLPMVVDADGLNALAGAMGCLDDAAGPRLLTPHPGEMARLLGGTVQQVQADRRGVAVEFARERGVTVALKGAGTVVTDGERVYVNPTGNPGLATGGTGDVLTGLAAGLLGQGLEPFAALQLAVFVHGLAGDLAAAERGELSLVAEDVLDSVPAAFQRVKSAGPEPTAESVMAQVEP